ncbi:thiaminase II [Stappia taiwanensis]|uniref:Aminopyrimidine aminohydrolase n=1 Tax=Stappia taiwanensis TaxID=992267 RepID=A0A838XR09_9HYPH|nr:thiaminase II [Stappia taiwanensis]MBA4612722.1 thiaminase II [Stappia taiwanensis]GGE90566.1 aminopyrimidine aminohydrolase [Stappia taiwanensis]
MTFHTTAPDFGSTVFARWRAEAGEDWHAYTRHAFVRGLGDGSLPQANFLHYLVQDYIFLFHFARAWALAVVKADNIAEARLAASIVDGLVNHEMSLHVDICGKAGIAEEALLQAEEERENLAYTRYVIDAGLSGDFLDVVAALAPCVFGYGEIGAALAAEAAPDATYRQWIDTYAGEEYHDMCRQVGALVDAAVEARLGPDPQSSPRWAMISRRFQAATRLEVGFWDMGLRG